MSLGFVVIPSMASEGYSPSDGVVITSAPLVVFNGQPRRVHSVLIVGSRLIGKRRDEGIPLLHVGGVSTGTNIITKPESCRPVGSRVGTALKMDISASGDARYNSASAKELKSSDRVRLSVSDQLRSTGDDNRRARQSAARSSQRSQCRPRRVAVQPSASVLSMITRSRKVSHWYTCSIS
jgi:hypothetical protein